MCFVYSRVFYYLILTSWNDPEQDMGHCNPFDPLTHPSEIFAARFFIQRWFWISNAILSQWPSILISANQKAYSRFRLNVLSSALGAYNTERTVAPQLKQPMRPVFHSIQFKGKSFLLTEKQTTPSSLKRPFQTLRKRDKHLPSVPDPPG